MSNDKQKNKNLSDDYSRTNFSLEGNLLFGPEYQNYLEKQTLEKINPKRNEDEDQKEKESRNTTSQIINPQKNKSSEDRNSNSKCNKSCLDKKINDLPNKDKELERLQKVVNQNNNGLQREFDSSDDKLDPTKINNLVGNKGKKESLRFIGQQDNILETTGFISKNNVLINTENIKEKIPLELNSQEEYEKYYEDLFIKIIKCSIDSITMLINERTKKNYGLDLNYIYKTRRRYELDKYNYKEFLNSKIKDIYLGKFLLINHEEKFEAEKWIYSLLFMENKNKNEKKKLLNILFQKEIRVIVLLYLDDYPYVSIKNKYNKNLNSELNLKRFKTFKDDFKDDFKDYNKDEQKKIKKNIRSLLIPVGKYNIRRKIMGKGLDNFHSFIKTNCKKYVERDLHKVTIKNQIGHSNEKYSFFFKKSIYDFYKDNKPRRLNEECKKDISKYTHNIDIINEAIEKEKEQIKEEDDRILGKIFNQKYNVKVKDILDIFMELKESIEIKGEKDIILEGFITYSDCFNEYKQYKKEENKKDFLELLNEEAKQRKSSDKRNRLLRGNPNLGKKRKNKDE